MNGSRWDLLTCVFNKNVCSIYSVPRRAVSALTNIYSVNSYNNSISYYYPHFTDVKAKRQSFMRAGNI